MWSPETGRAVRIRAGMRSPAHLVPLGELERLSLARQPLPGLEPRAPLRTGASRSTGTPENRGEQGQTGPAMGAIFAPLAPELTGRATRHVWGGLCPAGAGIAFAGLYGAPDARLAYAPLVCTFARAV